MDLKKNLHFSLNLNSLSYDTCLYSIAYICVLKPDRMLVWKGSGCTCSANVTLWVWLSRVRHVICKDVKYVCEYVCVMRIRIRLRIHLRILKYTNLTDLGRSRFKNDFLFNEILPCVRNCPLDVRIDVVNLTNDNPYCQIKIFWNFQTNRSYNYKVDFLIRIYISLCSK